jgi:hypothetical protein
VLQGNGAAKHGKVHYKGPMDVASRVWATEGGVRGLYKGLLPTMSREIPGNALMFGAYEAMKQKARQMQVFSVRLPKISDSLLCGPPLPGLITHAMFVKGI